MHTLHLLARFGRLVAAAAWVATRITGRRILLLARRPWTPSDVYTERLWRLRGLALRALCQDMGATFIKLGQILSTRRDLMPPAALAELEKLQDDVPGFDGALAKATFEQEFGIRTEDAFERFDLLPVASASVAQVHRGILKDGREVAVKIVRPGVGRMIELDTRLLLILVGMVARLVPSLAESILGLSRKFAEMLRQQTDLRIEAVNNRGFRQDFADDTTIVRFPELIEEFCGCTVMTMEFIRGCKPTHLANGSPDPKTLARNLLYIYYKMVLHGRLHADLHPGNLLVAPEEFIWVYDLGLVSAFDWEGRRGFFEAWVSFFMSNGAPLARWLVQLSLSHKIRDMAQLEADVTAFLKRSVPDKICDLEFGRILVSLTDIQRRYGMVAKPELTGVMLSLVAAEGLCRHLCPTLNLGLTVAPFLKRFLRKLYTMDPRLQAPPPDQGLPAVPPSAPSAA
ncbi:MAG: AarF/ABC1/UbiB kinase family protein [Nitrospirae bacterium]|nr:AarF/ABC1/UbiB kinase family protein [Nitrospirota bacterium]